jgi:hypothetical protein
MMATTKRVLTDEEVLQRFIAEKAERERLIREARANLEAYGSALPPIGAPPVAVKAPPVADDGVTRIGPRVKAKIAPKWFKVLKTCPHCGVEKNVGKDFGVVIRRGLESAAGWCRACRNTTSYKTAPRKNRRLE